MTLLEAFILGCVLGTNIGYVFFSLMRMTHA